MAAALVIAAIPTALAAGGVFSDVPDGAWYADAVEYVYDNGLMSGTGATTFSPDTATSRAMLATILYRVSGSPAVSGRDSFTDTDDGAWYADAVLWATQSGVMAGYGGGLFGANDPVTREQIATILWRYAGSPAAEGGQDFADESRIASYAVDAVDWVRANSIMNGIGGNHFDPQGNATRAQVATILRNYMTMDQEEPAQGNRILVAYFSASGNTEAVAETIADTRNADLFELVPADPYTDADLDWTESGSRVNREHENEALRDVELASATMENWEDYDTVFIGYPIWWGIAAWPVNDFIQSNDFSGKTVIPFCTSTSSGLGQSAELLEELAGTGTWLEGQRFRSGVSQADVTDWVNGLDI